MDRENTKKGADELNEYIEFEEGIFGFEQEKNSFPLHSKKAATLLYTCKVQRMKSFHL